MGNFFVHVQIFDGYSDSSTLLLDLVVPDGGDQVYNGTTHPSGFQALITVTQSKNDHHFSAVFTYSTQGDFLFIFEVESSKDGEVV